MANYWSKEIKSILGPCATAPQVDGSVPSLNGSAAPVLSQVYQEQHTGTPSKRSVGSRTLQMMTWTRELDQFRHDWLMGELEVDEDGRRERQPSRNKIEKPCKIKTP